jgi:hypothetical protein
MLRHKGGHKVRRGTYWDLASGHREYIDKEGVLPGDERTTYVRVPAVLMLLAGPFVGLAYVVLLPFIAIATVVLLVGGHLFGSLAGLVGRSFSFVWTPSESYLSGRKKRTRKEKKDDR